MNTQPALLLLFATSLQAQQAGVKHARVVAERGDSAKLGAVVREHPEDAREALGLLLDSAARTPTAAHAIIRIARRVASSYSAVWDDSFPVLNVARFERLSGTQRLAKATADSLRLAGNDSTGSASMRLWRSALRRSLAVPDSAGAAAALGNIAGGHYESGDLDSAEFYATRAKRIADVAGDRRPALNAEGLLGNIAMDRGDYRRASEILNRTLAQRLKSGDLRGAVADHTNLGLLSADLAASDEARAHYQSALGLARAHGFGEAAATALLNIANLDSEEGAIASAAAKYAEALALYQAAGRDDDVALVRHNLGLLGIRRGDYRAARIELTAALGTFRRSGAIEDQVQVRRDLASVEIGAGDLQSALSHLHHAEQLLLRMPRDYGVAAGVALARADLAISLNSFADAERQYARARSLYQRAGDAAGETEAQHGHSMLLLERKRFEQAIDELEITERRQLSLGDRRPAALTHFWIGRAYELQGRSVEARRAFEQSVDTLRAIGDPVSQAAAVAALGRLDLDGGTPLAAEARFREGLALVTSRSAPSVAWELRVGLASALRARGDRDGAAAELRTAIAEIERVAGDLYLPERRSAFLADKWEGYEALVLLEQERGDVAAAFAASERARAQQTREVLASGRIVGARDTSFVARTKDLQLRISEFTQRLEGDGRVARTLRGPDLATGGDAVLRESLARAQQEFAEMRLQSREVAGASGTATADVASAKAIAARLQPDEAMLSYFISDSAAMVFVVTRDTVRAVTLGGRRRELATLIDFTREHTSRRQSAVNVRPWRTPLRTLHEQLIKPIESAGLFTGVKKLVIVPHAELHSLPFAALLGSSASDDFLIERFEITYAPSASVWLSVGERSRTAGDRVLALAPRVAELPGSRHEVESLRALYGDRATVLTGPAATEQAFRNSAGGFAVVHLASYGVLNQHNPLFSFVELSAGGGHDGRLEVHEVNELTLNARLLVLSACQTALASGASADVPAGDDWIGLVRSFLEAGAENVVATLWAIEDRSTAGFMRSLHERLRAGDSEAAALAGAQRESLRKAATADPFYWAGFVHVGGPSR